MIKLIKSTFYRETQTKKALCAFINTASQLSFGNQCIDFEKKFARWQGRVECIMVNSGSSANLAIIQALLNLGHLKKGDAVGFSAVTWSTNVMPIIQLGLNPIAIDVEMSTLNISPKKLSEITSTKKLKMLFLTNLLGFCDQIDLIVDICRQKKIILIEDNCESLGSVYHGRKLGNFGLASTFSFYVGHHMSTVEGGAVCTDDHELATMLRLVRAHGWDRNLDFAGQEAIRKKFRVNSTFYSRYTFYDLGYNMRPTEITGFLGLNQLKYLDEIISKRQKNFRYFARRIYVNKEKYHWLDFSHMDIQSNFAVPIVTRSREYRDELVSECEGVVEIRPIVGGDMKLQPFYNKYVKSHRNCPNAEIIHKQGLYFANNPELTRQEMKTILAIFSPHET